MNGVEAVRFSGSRGGRAHMAAQASRWKRLPQIEEAIVALRKAHEVDSADLWTLTMKALRELVQDKSNPNARARACELMAKLQGKLQPETHQHLHADIEVPQLSESEGRQEMVRLVRIALNAMPAEQRAELVREALGQPAIAGEASGE